MSSGEALVGLVGDVLVDRAHPREAFAEVREVLAAPDILFANLEGAFSDTPDPPSVAGHRLIAGPHNLDAIVDAGFDVLSLANNHSMDAGAKAMLETSMRLRADGVACCGAGVDLDEACRPAFVERNGLRVAFLAYTSVYPTGIAATSAQPGVAAVRATEQYLHRHDYHLPGVPPHIRSQLDETDRQALISHIAQAKKQAELVIVSFHWGDTLQPCHITHHERRTAQLCVQSGADLVVGHHHHELRGFEWHRGKPILYGLGHFVFDCRLVDTDPAFTAYDHAVYPRRGWPLLPMHPDARMTLMAWAVADRSGVHHLGIIPCRLQKDGRVKPVHPQSVQGREIQRYLTRCCVSQRLNGRIGRPATLPGGTIEGLEIVPRGCGDLSH
jgi:poly-gamma-glutamate capsule biosynthesis protein CapA/YwtB (metallophosphatase superfamily)